MDTYLSPIHIPLTQLVKITLTKQLRLLTLLRHRLHFTHMMLPNLLARFGLQVLVPNSHVDAALERLVKRLHAIRRQEQNALVVLREPQEHRYEAIAMNIVGLTRFEEHVGLVEEKDGAPGVRNVHDAVEVLFEAAAVGAEFASGDGVQWTV
jgi:hypothetical protein